MNNELRQYILEKEYYTPKGKYGSLDPYKYNTDAKKIASILGASVVFGVEIAIVISHIRDFMNFLKQMEAFERERAKAWERFKRDNPGKSDKDYDDFKKGYSSSSSGYSGSDPNSSDNFSRRQSKKYNYSSMDPKERAKHERLDKVLYAMYDTKKKSTGGSRDSEIESLRSAAERLASKLGRNVEMPESLDPSQLMSKFIGKSMVNIGLNRAKKELPTDSTTTKRSMIGALLGAITGFMISNGSKTLKNNAYGTAGKILATILGIMGGALAGEIVDFFLKVFNKEERIKYILNLIKNTKNKKDKANYSYDLIHEIGLLPENKREKYAEVIKKGEEAILIASIKAEARLKK